MLRKRGQSDSRAVRGAASRGLLLSWRVWRNPGRTVFVVNMGLFMTLSLIFAQAGAASSSTGAIIMNIVPLILIFVVFYFLLIRPQQRRMKEHAAKIGAAKRGDTVVTGGGIVGKVTKATDDELEVEIATGVKVKVVRSTLADVVSPTGTPAND